MQSLSSFSSSRNLQCSRPTCNDQIRYHLAPPFTLHLHILTWESLLSCWQYNASTTCCAPYLPGISSRQILWRWYKQCGRNVRHLTSLSCSYQRLPHQARHLSDAKLSMSHDAGSNVEPSALTLSPHHVGRFKSWAPSWVVPNFEPIAPTLSPMASPSCSIDVVVVIARATTAVSSANTPRGLD